MMTKRCKCCQRELPIWKFNTARDAYTDEARWLRNTCNRCYNGQRRIRQRAAWQQAVGVTQLAFW